VTWASARWTATARAVLPITPEAGSVNPQRGLSQQQLFFRQFIRHPFETGAILPSSRALGRAMVAYLARKQGRADVLEVGAGSGAFTTAILPLLQPGDTLDVVEINPELMAFLRQRLEREFPMPTDSVRVRFFNDDVRHAPLEQDYDYIVFSLPLTNFPLAMVQEILERMLRHLKPGGVFSYVKYIGLGRLKYLASSAAARADMRAKQAYVDRLARQYQVERRAVLRSLPPAWTFYWRKPGGSNA
jgi:phosphatidylethanolamine/phosphatidyl-N-methylethanolamine N-methyltransferase